MLFISDNVELILKGVAVRHSSDYDSVASDEDTDQELPSSKGDRTKVFRHWLLFYKRKDKPPLVGGFAVNPFPQQSLDSDLSDGPVTMHEYMEVKNALTASEVKIQKLLKANDDLNEELRLMQKKVSPALHQWDH